MIKNYDRYTKYINKKPLLEKLEINISDLINNIDNKVVNSFDKVKNKIFMENTTDGHVINMDDEYFVIVEYKLIKDKNNKSKQTLNDKIFWGTLKLTEKEDLFYKYKIIDTDIDIPKSDGTILEDLDNIKVIKSSEEKIPINRINGFYLYKEKIDLNDVLNSYNIKYNEKNLKKPEEKKRKIKINPGFVYKINNSSGDEVSISISSIKDEIVQGDDINKVQSYPNMNINKIKTNKNMGKTFDILKKKTISLDINKWKSSTDYKELHDKKSQVKFIDNKLSLLKNTSTILNKLLDIKIYQNRESINNINSLSKDIENSIKKINGFKKRSFDKIKNKGKDGNKGGNKDGNKETQKVEVKEKTQEENTNDDIKEMNDKSNKVQTQIQKSK